MALAERIKQNTGGLAEMSAEELAAQTGRTQSPVQPLETSTIGGNPDQAKMAGTPAQKGSALRQAIQGSQDLATVQRQEQVNKQASTEQKQQVAKAQQLEGLGSLSDRVTQLANQALESTQGAELTATGQSADVNALLTQLKANPNDPALIQQLNTALGKTEIADQLTGQQLLELYDPEAQTIAASFGRTVSEALQAGKLPLKELGFNTPDDLASALGIPSEQLQGMSIPDLVENINKVIDTEFQQTSALEAQANDPNLSAVERAEARKQLRELGAVGIRSAESDVDKLADEVASAGTIKVDGKDVALDQVMEDETVSATIANYLDGLDDKGEPLTDIAKAIAKNSPELVKFINKHKEVLKAAAEKIDAGAKAYAATQEANKSIAKGQDGAQIPDNVMKQIFPDWGSTRTSPYDISGYPFLQLMNDPLIGKQASENIPKIMEELAQLGPEFIKEFSTMSRDQLAKIGALGDLNAYNQYKANLAASQQIKKMETPDDLAAVLGVGSASDLVKLKDNIIKAVNIGKLDPSTLTNLPGLAEGNFAQTINHLKKLSPTSLQSMMAVMGPLTKAINDVNSAGKEPLGIPDALSPAFIDSKQLNAGHITKYAKTMPINDLATTLATHPELFDSTGRREAEDWITLNASNKAMDDVKKNVGVNVPDLIKLAELNSFETADDLNSAITNIDKAMKTVINSNQGLDPQYVQKLLDQLTSAKITLETNGQAGLQARAEKKKKDAFEKERERLKQEKIRRIQDSRDRANKVQFDDRGSISRTLIPRQPEPMEINTQTKPSVAKTSLAKAVNRKQPGRGSQR